MLQHEHHDFRQHRIQVQVPAVMQIRLQKRINTTSSFSLVSIILAYIATYIFILAQIEKKTLINRSLSFEILNRTDPSMNSYQRISILEKKIQDLRKTYHTLKTELASIDRRRKKIKRREREIKKVQKQLHGGSTSNASQATSNVQATHST